MLSEWRKNILILIYKRLCYLQEVMLWDLEDKEVPLKYIKLVKNLYDGIVISVRTSGGITSKKISIIIVLYLGSILSAYLFALVRDELTKSVTT